MKNTETLQFTAKVLSINKWSIVCLPLDVSKKLPSRGMTVVEGTVNDTPLKVPLEPDGRGGHWFKIEDSLLKALKVKEGTDLHFSFSVSDEWPEPHIPKDLKNALHDSPSAQSLWNAVTPNAHWDWIRWVQSTKEEETRKRRIKVAISKLNAGTRRPCCFNRSMCCEPAVSKSGLLLIP